MSIIDFAAAKAEREPHWAGECKCINCGHEWVGVGPSGVMWIECPSCGLNKGSPKYPFGPPKGSLELICVCGCDLMSVYKTSDGGVQIMCVSCGTSQTEAAFGDG